MNSLLAAFNGLPRAARWLVAFGLFVGAYFVVIEPVLDATNSLRARADVLAAGLRRERDLGSPESEEGRILQVGATNFGVPRLPTDPGVRAEAVHRLLAEVLEDHGVDERTVQEKRASLSDPRRTALVGEAGRIDRVILEVTFEASPETVAEIIADLESAPEVTAVSRVKLDRAAVRGGGDDGDRRSDNADRLVRSNIDVEAWVPVAVRGAAPGVGGEGNTP